MYKGQLVKRRHNLSTQEPILASNSSTGEITIDNSKLLQPITEPESIH